MTCRHRHLMLHSLLFLFFIVVSQGCRCATLSSSSDSPSPSSSSTSGGSASLPSARVDAIKAEILDKLGMDGVPDMERLHGRTEGTEAQRIVELYEETHRELSAKTHNISGEDAEESAKQFYSFDSVENYGRIPKSIRRRKRSVYIFFRIQTNRRRRRQSETHELDVTEATLKLFKNRMQHLKRTDGGKKSIRVKIYQLIRTNGEGSGRRRGTESRNGRDKRRQGSVGAGNHTKLTNGRKHRNGTAWLKRSPSKAAVKNRTRRRFRRRLLQSRTVSLETSGHWEEFDVLDAAKDWISDPSSNHGLLITTDSANHSLRSVFGFRRNTAANSSRSVEAGNRKPPALTVLVRERLRTSVRHRRSLEGPTDCEAGDGERRCCRFSLWISFADLGWGDWILAPQGYLAHFCDGTCPHRYRLANRFSGIKALVNARSPASAPSPCCSATRMSPLPIAHYNQFGHAVISVFDDMIVEECRCS